MPSPDKPVRDTHDTPAPNPNGHATRIPGDDLTMDMLENATVYSADNSEIGSISKIIDDGAKRQAIVDAGGFLGVTTRQVALDLNELEFVKDKEGALRAMSRWDKEEIGNLPEFLPRID